MSKTSPKKRYTQLMSWLETYKSSPKAKTVPVLISVG